MNPTLPPLTPDQVTSIRQEAINRVLKFIGNPPVLDEYLQRRIPPEPVFEYRPRPLREHVQPTDYLIPPLFAALLVISMSHILTFAGTIAHGIYEPAPAGFSGVWIGLGAFTLLHQIGFFVFSEIGVLFFYTRHALYRHQSGKMFSLSLLFAILCTLVSVYANVTALTHNAQNLSDFLIGGFVGLLVPAITLVLGERLSEIVRLILLHRRRAYAEYRQEYDNYQKRIQEVRRQYEADLQQWQMWASNPESFDLKDGYNSYLRYLGEAIIHHYRSVVHNKDYEWTIEEEDELARRELSGILRPRQFLPTPRPRRSARITDADAENLEVPPAKSRRRSKSGKQPKKSNQASLRSVLISRPDLATLSAAEIVDRLAKEGYSRAFSLQYVNRVKRALTKA
jgi:hypothetical protein